MLLNIEPQKGINDCIADQIITVAKWLNIDYELMFSETWNFKYKLKINDNELIGKRFGTGSSEIFFLLEKYHGLKMNYHKYTENSKIIEVIHNNIMNHMPILILMDSFWCPWDNYYKKDYHHLHAFLINGIDIKSHNVICSDAYYLKKNIDLSFDDLFNGCIAFYTFEVIDCSNKDITWQEIIRKAVDIVKSKENIFSSIKYFADEISTKKSFKDEINNIDKFFITPIGYNLDEIIFSRLKFMKTLEYIHIKYNINQMIKFIDNFKIIVSKWSMVKSIIIKSYYAKNEKDNCLRIASILYDIAEKEEKIADDLLRITNDNMEILNSYAKQSSEDSNSNGLYFVDLNPHYNNKCFDNLISPKYNADFTGLGHFALLNEADLLGIKSVNNLSYCIPPLLNLENDNLSCTGQSIPIMEDVYNKIMILGCSEYGDYVDSFQIEDIEGEREEILIEFTDWSFLSKENEYVAWEGNQAIINNGQLVIPENKVRLFASEYVINKKTKINKISVPNCPNIHIFAISLKNSKSNS